jgi:hypothetical protein
MTVKSILWTGLVCHHEVTLATSQPMQFNSNPGHTHWEAAKYVLKYLNGAKDRDLMLRGDPQDVAMLIVFSDMNLAEDPDNWCSCQDMWLY